ncbi:MAG: transglutaminase TgpA family protein [Actinomycetota bacterium]
MAHPQGTTLRTQRLIALLAICSIAIATAFAFGRVFAGHGSTWRLMAVALASAVVASALERRNLLLATLVSAALLAIAIGLILYPWTTWHGFPTLDTFRHALDASRLVREQARLQVAPTIPLKPLMLASIVAMWAAMFSCHALAFRAGSPLLSLLPPIAMLAFADTVLEDLIKPQYGVAFLAAALIVVFADALRRVQGWGPVWTGPGSRARLSATASHGARRVAVAAVATAALVPLLMPGFGSKAIFDINSTNSSDRVRIDPLVSIKAALTRKDPVEVFQVTSNVGSYWRMLSLPDFNGDTFLPDNAAQGQPITPETVISSGAPRSQTIDQTFRVSSNLGFPWLPVAYPPQQIEVPGTSVRFNDDTGTAIVENNLDAGTAYHVTSVAQQPTPEQLATEVIPPPAQDPRYTDLSQLPTDVAAGIHQIAEAWTAGATNDYERILAIQDHLNDPSVFTYDQTVPPRDDSYTLLNFLEQTRRGFCQQFASAMAIMVRSIGFPSRVAVGFTPGTFDADAGVWHVTTKDAHSWVEVRFPTYGWLAFEPTPGRINPIAEGYQHPAVVCPSGAPGCTPTGGAGGPNAPGTSGSAGNLPGQLRNIDRRDFQTGVALPPLPPGRVAGKQGRHVPIGTVASFLFGLALLVACLIPPVRALRQRAHLLRAGHAPRALILATYDVFTERAADLGYGRGPGETLDEFRRRLSTSGALKDGHLDRLTSIAVRAAYASQDPPESDAREASEAASTALRDLRERTAWGRRIAGHYRVRQ